MRVIQAYTVEQALGYGLSLLHNEGYRRPSRNGDVIVMDSPVTTEYLQPRNRVLFWAARDANPFFHFFESLWMLAGRNDLAFLTQFVKRFETFSDDGKILHGAYGHRWRKHFDLEGGGHPKLPDQLPIIIERLKNNRDDRRTVLTMWDPVADLDSSSRDVCCNTHIYFSRGQQGQLDMTVCCRSNDIIFGCYGANAVHFSVLQEVLAAGMDAPVGQYWQMSNNFHAYREVFDPLFDKYYSNDKFYGQDYYIIGRTYPYQIVNSPIMEWFDDLQLFFEHKDTTMCKDIFFHKVVAPLWTAYHLVKEKKFNAAMSLLASQPNNKTDWFIACYEWINRRKANYERAKDDGPNYK